MEMLRKTGAGLLMLYGAASVVTAAIEAAAGREVAFHLAELAMSACFGVSGWLLWRRERPRRVGAMLLIGVGAFSLLMGMSDAVAGREPATYVLVVELRFGLPGLLCGWLMWRGHPARQIGAVLILLWAASFTLQAVAYSDEPIAAVVIIIRSGVPGFVCSWLLWRGGELRQIAAVLLFSWPASYMIYALQRADWDTATGEVLIGAPTMVVGWLLWPRRERPLMGLASTAETPAGEDEGRPWTG